MSGRQRLYLSVVIICLATCRPYGHKYEGFGSAFPCLGSGWDNRQGPIVCVNSETLATSPEPIRVHNRQKGNPKHPVVVQWFTSSGGGDLEIRMVDAGCLEDIRCPSPGHCRAKTNIGGAGKECKYSVILDRRENDPTVIVEDCCM